MAIDVFKLVETMGNKAAQALTVEACEAAIRDIDATLELHKHKPLSDPYNQQLWAERDAFIDRKLELSGYLTS